MAPKSASLHPKLWLFSGLAIVVALSIMSLRYLPATLESLQLVWQRLPYILIGNQNGWAIRGGFAMNLIISLVCMAISTGLGVGVGLARLAPQRPLRWLAWGFIQFFRNSPWLVVLYGMLYLLPFQINLGLVQVEFSAIAKSILGLSLVLAANIAEIVRGAVQSIPREQWEASVAMGFTRSQILRLVILPQALQRMLPPWMNWYAILTMGTTLTNLVGVPEGLTAVREVVEQEGEAFAVPFYTILLLLFFVYCYPIARWTRKLEAKLS